MLCVRTALMKGKEREGLLALCRYRRSFKAGHDLDIDNKFNVDSNLDNYIKDNGPPGQAFSVL